MRKHKVSAFIPVQNVEDIIEECLKSIAWVDEIFIVDAFSTDRTVEICRKYPNVKIVQHEYVNSGLQRTWGMPQVAHEWVLIIDSDERCTPRLREEIETILAADDIPFDGYKVNIRTRFYGRLLSHKTHLGHRGKRLVRKLLHEKFVMKRVHAGMRIKNLAWIRNKDAYLVHIPIRDFGSQWQKMIRYATWAAEDMYEKGTEVRWYHFSLRPLYKFLHFYIVRGGFRDGVRGLIVCAIAGIGVFMKYLRLFELKQERT
jgi:glycosyltransferase involved in cell wall biosynthesis